jgi:carboxymethylenebutenolidase
VRSAGLLRVSAAPASTSALGSDLAAGVPFYGVQPSAADAAKIKGRSMRNMDELDKRITDGWPAFDAALTEAHVPHEGQI